VAHAAPFTGPPLRGRRGAIDSGLVDVRVKLRSADVQPALYTASALESRIDFTPFLRAVRTLAYRGRKSPDARCRRPEWLPFRIAPDVQA
jgi:hypothetical protein